MKEVILHTSFTLQGKSFSSSEELIGFAEKISVEISIFFKEWFNEEDFLFVKTSGSTGAPKLISIQKKYMINSALATGLYFKLPEKTKALLCMSANYIAGKMMLVRAVTLGWELDVVAVNSNPLKNCEKEYDFAAMVPLQLANSLANVYLIKKLIVGGGNVSNELMAKLQTIPTKIFATYGMTETITHIAIKKLNHFSENKTFNSSNYQLLPGISIDKDERNCLIINAPSISSNRIITNDLVEIISDKEFKWLGRFDSVINSGGIKLIPEQIEFKLSKIYKNRFFIAGIPDKKLGEKVIIVFEKPENLNHNEFKNQFYSEIKKNPDLLNYEQPKEVYFVKKFVETETNKINRTETLKLIINTSKKF